MPAPRADNGRVADVDLRLGDLATSEELIRDLYLDLRGRVRRWASVTKQTSQARMGYVGQHLVSVVTGYPGTRTGARGADLVLPEGRDGEIKTCYRIDQLGKCETKRGDGTKCGTGVGPDERVCSSCGGSKIKRKDDSKWLITLRDEKELAEVLDPAVYYLVLFEFTSLTKPDTIQASIWSVDPLVPGFALALVDYYFNIRAKSKSKAAFNLWPYRLKFELMRPSLIYRSLIGADDSIKTVRFPGRDASERHALSPMDRHKRTDIEEHEWLGIAQALGAAPEGIATGELARKFIQAQREDREIHDDEMCDRLARGYYGPRIAEHLEKLPEKLREPVKKALTP